MLLRLPALTSAKAEVRSETLDKCFRIARWSGGELQPVPPAAVPLEAMCTTAQTILPAAAMMSDGRYAHAASMLCIVRILVTLAAAVILPPRVPIRTRSASTQECRR